MPVVVKIEVQKTERPNAFKAIYNNPKLRGQLTISPVKTVTDVSFNAILVLFFIIKNGVSNEIRTHVAALKGQCPNQLDDRDKSGGMEHLSILQEYY